MMQVLVCLATGCRHRNFWCFSWLLLESCRHFYRMVSAVLLVIKKVFGDARAFYDGLSDVLCNRIDDELFNCYCTSV